MMKTKKKLPITRIIVGIMAISVIMVLFGGSYLTKQINSQLVQQSVLERDLIVIETNQTYIDQILDNVDYCPEIGKTCATATEKFGITIQPVIIDSNNRQIPLNATFYNIQKASLTDPQGNLLDLGNFNAGFFAVTNIDDTITVTAQYKVLLNGNEIISNELFASGKTEKRHLLLKTGDRKTFAYNFADEPESTFKQGINANLFEIYITNVDAVVGSTLDTTKRFLSDEEFPIFRMVLSFDGNKHVLRDYTGTAVSVFKSDNVLRACGQAYLYQEKVPFRDFVYTRKQGFVNPPMVEVYQNENKIGQTTIPDYSKTKSDAGFHGSACSEISGIPRESTVTYKIEGNNYQIKTGKVQEIHSVICSHTGIRHGIPQTACSSSFGWSK